MKVIIVGLGRTGSLLAEWLSMEKHDVVVVDNNKEKVDAITDKYNVSGVCGSGASKQILLKAGADTADIIIAVAPTDEINMMSCLVAKKCGTRYAAARMNQPEFAEDKAYFNQEFQLDYVFNPKLDTANEIAMQIGMPGSVRASGFFSSKAVLANIHITEENPLAGMSLMDVKGFFESDMLIVSVKREDKVFIPKGDFVLQAGDDVDLISSMESLSKIFIKLELIRKPIKNILIVGGGDIAHYLIRQLVEQKKNVTVLDNDLARCQELSKQFDEIDVEYGSGIDGEALLEEGIKNKDACVSLTGADETNLVISMFAWSCGVNSVITKVNSPSYEKLLHKVNIDVTISPTVISAEKMVRFVRNVAIMADKGNDITRIHRIAGGNAEAVEFTVSSKFHKKDISFKSADFKLKKDVIIAAIIRGEEVIIPSGDSCLKEGDHVVLVGLSKNKFTTLEEAFH